MNSHHRPPRITALLRRQPCLLALLGTWLVFSAMAASAQTQPYMPELLKPWAPWVLHEREYLGCPFSANQVFGTPAAHLCAWPGALQVRTDASGAVFEQRWRMWQEGWVMLPGDAKHWPVEVRSNSTPVAVMLRDSRPHVWLGAGEHELHGRIRWQRQPARLTIPASTGMVNLQVSGKQIEQPIWKGNALWLGEAGVREEDTQRAALQVRVWRKLSDGLPMTLETRLSLNVAGPGREVVLGRLMPEGFAPMMLRSALLARVEGDGRLRIQLRPGDWELTFLSRALTLPQSLPFIPGEGDWAAQEIWSYARNDLLRATVATAPNRVDPTQTDVPPSWHHLPAFALAPGDAIRIEEQTRGQAQTLENRITLQRQLWVDFDGGGMTTVDALSGEMVRDWRLEMRAPYRLLSASASNSNNLLVTTDNDAQHTGVEVRAPRLALTAISRIEKPDASLPATGWQSSLNDVSVTAHLPPGHRLLAVSGADLAYGTWAGAWTLLDYFLVLLIAVTVGRLYGVPFGLCALLLLVLIRHEPNAPLWTWLGALTFIALVRSAPEGRLRTVARLARGGAFALLLGWAVLFAAQHLRLAMYPQLDTGSIRTYSTAIVNEFDQAEALPAPASDMQDAGALANQRKASGKISAQLEEVLVTGSRRTYSDKVSGYAPGALVQTGPGIPTWRYHSYRFEWRGPVTSEQMVRLWVLSPWVYTPLRVLGILLLALLLWRFAREIAAEERVITSALLPTRGTDSNAGSAAAVLAAALLGLCMGLPAPADAQDRRAVLEDGAQIPDASLLQELQQRLVQPPQCAPSCAQISRAEVQVRGNTLRIRGQIHAMQRSALPIPGRGDGWRASAIALNGQTQRFFRRDAGGVVWLVVEAGIHSFEASGRMPTQNVLSLPFAMRPHYLTVDAQGWEFSGVDGNTLPSGVLELVRVTQNEDGAALEPTQFPPFVTVRRTVVLNVDWEMQTIVERRAPLAGGFSVQVPLMAGESPRSETLQIRDGHALVGMGAGQNSVTWVSALPVQPSLTLDAGAHEQGAIAREEIWSIVPSPIWRIGFDGTPITNTTVPAGDHWVAEFHPRPGETLRIDVARPQAIEGDTIAFDNVHLTSASGNRSIEHTLALRYRSTRGGRHAITLPGNAQVKEVIANGSALSIRPDEGVLELPVVPGSGHTLQVRWVESTETGFTEHTPMVDIGTEASNVTLNIQPSRDRWVLLTRGPALGPAVLLWSELVVFALIAFALARVPHSPLKAWQWLLLGLGFSTFSWGVLMLTGIWLFALSARERVDAFTKRWQFNLMQVALALLTLVTLISLIASVPSALLGQPDMHIAGNNSSVFGLNWFADRINGALPVASILSVPMWIYKTAILAWALWLSFAMLGWLRQAWQVWSGDGLWRSAPPKTRTKTTDRNIDDTPAKTAGKSADDPG